MSRAVETESIIFNKTNSIVILFNMVGNLEIKDFEVGSLVTNTQKSLHDSFEL